LCRCDHLFPPNVKDIKENIRETIQHYTWTHRSGETKEYENGICCGVRSKAAWLGIRKNVSQWSDMLHDDIQGFFLNEAEKCA
jgi:hypothetical protein